MAYSIQWNKDAEKDLSKLQKQDASRIVRKVEQMLVQEPYKLGTALKGRFLGLHRYRVGNYRVIYEIVDEKVLVMVLQIGHRSKIYDR